MLDIKVCDECGKTFIPAAQHLYRIKRLSKWYCSYKCWTKAGGDNADKRKR